MKTFVSVALVSAALWSSVLGGPAFVAAQTSGSPAPAVGGFTTLSPGNQKIARALFDAQQTAPAGPTTGSATATKVYSLDEIAALKQSGQGWGEIFKTMQAQGQLPGAKNLGQVVSGHYQPPAPAAAATTPAPPSGNPTSGTPSGSPGTFARLSPGNQKIARALFDAQQTAPAGTTTGSATATKVYSLDEIAALKQSGQGWGGVFREMQAQGQLAGAKNLGQVVSARYGSAGGTTTITTAGGRTDVVSTGRSAATAQSAVRASTGGAGTSSSGGGRSGGMSVTSRGSGGQAHVAHGKPETSVGPSQGRGQFK
jgi:pyruvate/2-oxoglutarate dehydrogenase complex dihydrolipoamide acyltransferase (E2) component